MLCDWVHSHLPQVRFTIRNQQLKGNKEVVAIYAASLPCRKQL